MRTIAPGPPASVNHTLPSPPTAIPVGTRSTVKPGVPPAGNSVTLPAVVIRPMPPGFACSVNQRLSSGPLTISPGWRSGRKALNSVTTPDGVMRPIRPPLPCSVKYTEAFIPQ